MRYLLIALFLAGCRDGPIEEWRRSSATIDQAIEGARVAGNALMRSNAASHGCLAVCEAEGQCGFEPDRGCLALRDSHCEQSMKCNTGGFCIARNGYCVR